MLIPRKTMLKLNTTEKVKIETEDPNSKESMLSIIVAPLDRIFLLVVPSEYGIYLIFALV